MRLGWGLYCISLVTPDLHRNRIGAQAFVAVIRTALDLLPQRDARAIAIGLCLIVGWLANFSILLRWPSRVRLAWIIAPWVPFVATLSVGGMVPSPVPLLYFYPWAIGIALIHLAQLKRQHAPAEYPLPHHRS